MRLFFSILLTFLLIISCRKDYEVYTPTPYPLEIPTHFPQMNIPKDNPITVEGFELGRKLFYEELLSSDNTMSCATCHNPASSFSDKNQFSQGVTGVFGKRNSMPLINMGWQQFFFWDGRSKTLEQQIFEPVRNPIEMNSSWKEAVHKLKHKIQYQELFKRAFGSYGIDSNRVSKALAQFIRTMISSNSQYDILYKQRNNFKLSKKDSLIFNQISPVAKFGYDLFENLDGADCFHCHNGFNLQVQKFSNNGLDETFLDPGRMTITNLPQDKGRFKVPTLRNIGFSAPYMHDGRFSTLDEVINHYSSGIKLSPTIDPGIEFAQFGGVNLTENEKIALKEFLITMNDTSFINNPIFQDPD